jgi:hypothetical protein
VHVPDQGIAARTRTVSLRICAVLAPVRPDLHCMLLVSDRERYQLTEANGPLMARLARPFWATTFRCSGRETPLARYVAAASLGAAGCPGAAEVVPVAVAVAVTPLLRHPHPCQVFPACRLTSRLLAVAGCFGRIFTGRGICNTEGQGRDYPPDWSPGVRGVFPADSIPMSTGPGSCPSLRANPSRVRST